MCLQLWPSLPTSTICYENQYRKHQTSKYIAINSSTFSSVHSLFTVKIRTDQSQREFHAGNRLENRTCSISAPAPVGTMRELKTSAGRVSTDTGAGNQLV